MWMKKNADGNSYGKVPLQLPNHNKPITDSEPHEPKNLFALRTLRALYYEFLAFVRVYIRHIGLNAIHPSHMVVQHRGSNVASKGQEAQLVLG